MGPRSAASAVALSFAALALAACGGAVATDLFSEPGADASAPPSPTGTATALPDGAVPPGPTPTPTVPPTTPTEPPPPPPPPPTDAGRPDARVDAGTDASTTVDAGGPGITCGPALSCELTETCCAVYVVATYRFECRPGTSASCPNPSTDIHCDSSEDCPASARVCCGDKSSSGTYYNDLTCKSSCTGADITFCNPASPAASCRPGQTCRESTILRGLYYCD